MITGTKFPFPLNMKIPDSQDFLKPPKTDNIVCILTLSMKTSSSVHCICSSIIKWMFLGCEICKIVWA